MNNSKYHYIAVTKPNASLTKFLSKRDRDRFCLNCFSNFQTDEKLKEHEKSCRKPDHVELEIPEKFKTILNKETAEMEELCGNILKHPLFSNSLQTLFIVVYDFELIIGEKDNQSKLGDLRKNKDESSTVKTGEHIPIRFALAVHYLEGKGHEN